MASSSYRTYRVRGIPAGTSYEGVKQLLQQVLVIDDASTIGIKSLASDLARPREMVATIDFKTVPEQLSDASSRAEWSFEVAERVTLRFDTHFIGCTTLSCPSSENWKFDLLAVPGLNGHAFGSFKKRGSSYMWLRDDLAYDFPECRVMIYGYDTKLNESKSFQNLPDIGQKFLNAIRGARPFPDKPLILLGHSLGGLVIKEAISIMRPGLTESNRLNFRAIRGLIFFGVPSQGMDIKALIPMVGIQANTGFLFTLGPNSPVLRRQTQEFPLALDDLRCGILSFYETQESPTAIFANGSWSMTGPPVILVDTFSATHGRPDEAQNHDVHPMECSHNDLVKLSSSYDEAYSTVVGCLQQINCSSEAIKVKLSRTEEDCSQSLGFLGDSYRLDALEPAPGTCRWLIRHELFTQWFEQPAGLLWIRGKPGTGKSMAMKSALNHLKATAKPEHLIASFFIHGQGSDLQKTPLGVYRSLIHQIYPYIPESFSSLTERHEKYTRDSGEESQDKKWSWQKEEIRQFLLNGLKKACRRYSIVILVDALDEAGEFQAKEIFRDLEGLLRSLDDPVCQLHMCVSCRHYPGITLGSGTTLVTENLNGPDIANVANAQINALDIFNNAEKLQLLTEILKKSEGIFLWMSLMTNTILRARERGDSFRIAFGDIDSVPKGLDLLYERLLSAEEDLIPPREVHQRRKLFQWVSLAAEPLSPQELQHALALDANMAQKSIDAYKKTDSFIAMEDLEAKIKHLSKGLIQIKGTFFDGRAELIHQSVLDYLLHSGGLPLLSGTPAKEALQRGEFDISRSCLKYLHMSEVTDFAKVPFHSDDHPVALAARVRYLKKRLPLIIYAWRHWILHAVRATLSDISQDSLNDDLWDIFGWPNDQSIIRLWLPLNKKLGCPLQSWLIAFHIWSHFYMPIRGYHPKDLFLWPTPGARLVHLLALCGLLGVSAQRKHVSDNTILATQTETGATPLICAIVGEQEDITRRLIHAGARVSSDTSNPMLSPIHLAARWGNARTISLLISSGSRVAPPKVKNYTPLHVSVLFGNVAATQILLATGAKTNVVADQRNSFIKGTTPMHLAAEQGHVEIMKCLLNYGAQVDETTFQGMTPLFTAIQSQSSNPVDFLLRHGASVEAEHRSQRTPLICALAWFSDKYHSMENHLAILQKLLEYGANPNRCFDKKSPLEWAVDRRHYTSANFLLHNGADANALGDSSGTALHLAVSCGDLKMVDVLVENNADVNAVDKGGFSPLYRAAIRSEGDIVRHLIGWGGRCERWLREHSGNLMPRHRSFKQVVRQASS